MTQDVAIHKIKSGWVFKALTPKARAWFLETLELPVALDGDVFIQNVSDLAYPNWMSTFARQGFNTDKPEPVKPDAKQYTDF